MTGRSSKHRQFELHILPRNDAGYGLILYEGPINHKETNEAGWQKVVQVWGDPLRLVIDQVLKTIRNNGYRPSDLKRTRNAPFRLSETDGVRLGLLFLAIKPLRKISRIETIAGRVQHMEEEEVLYWFSKTAESGEGRRSQRAFRILMAEE